MARLRTAFVTLFAGTIALSLTGCSNPDEGKTPFAPPAGQAREVFWTQVVDTNVKVPAMGMDDTSTSTTKMNLLATPGEAGADGTTDVEFTFDYFDTAVAGAQNAALGGMDPNATNKAVAKGMMGKSITAGVDSGGYVIRLDGTDALADAVVSEMSEIEYPAEMGDAVKELAEEAVRQQFGHDAIKNLAETFTAPRSIESLEPGVTWTGSGKVDFGMLPTDVTHTYTVIERTDAAVTVEHTSTFTLDPNGKTMVEMIKLNPMAAQMGEPTFDINGSGTGSYSIDTTTGWAQSYDGSVTLKGTLALGPMNAEMNITIAEDFTSNFQ